MNAFPVPLLIMAGAYWLGAMVVGGLIAAHYRVSGLHRNGLLEQETTGPALDRYLKNPRRFQVTAGTIFLMLSLMGGFAWGKLLLIMRSEIMDPAFWGIFLLVILVAWSLGGVAIRMLASATAVTYARVVGTLIYPVAWLFGPWATLLLAVMDRVDDTIWSGDMQQHLSAGEIRELISADGDQSTLDEDEREMIQSIFEFHDTAVREIMIPRIDMVTLDGDSEVDKMVDTVNENGHSRIPVFQGNVDNVIGILYSKDLLKLVKDGNFDDHGQKLADMVRPAYFIPESKKIDEVLDEFRSQRIHMAVVIDEYGGTAGLVTIEDLIEEIIGEIEDEHDQNEVPQLLPAGNGAYIADARVEIEILEDAIGAFVNDEERENIDTLGGLVFSLAGRVPIRGELVPHPSGIEFEVLEADPRRIRRLRLRTATPHK